MTNFILAAPVAIDPVATGKRIRCVCRERRITVAQLSEFLGLSEQALYKWFRGDCTPTTDNLLSMAKAFGLHMDDLVVTYQDELEGDDKSSSFFAQKLKLLNHRVILSVDRSSYNMFRT